MSVLSGPELEARIKSGEIGIEPYDAQWVGPNSIDLHLAELSRYQIRRDPLDPENLPPLVPLKLRRDGRWLLQPGHLYIGLTKEKVSTKGYTWMLGLRSSAGRLGIDSLAGIGDDAFRGRITVELTVVHPLLLRPGSRLFQLTFWPILGVRREYSGRYQDAEVAEASKLAEEP